MVEAGRLGVVVIGRNEGIRLERCLESLRREHPRTVYVDSHSSDGSVSLARALGVEVVELTASAPLTPARGRNAGWRILEERLPELEFIQFVDGDCELQPGWLEAGVAYLREHADVAVVCGRLRERSRDRNLYHRLADMEWDLPPGEAEYCGGIGMFRADALRAVGGFDESLAAGEEPELCLRLQRRGDRVMRLADEMALHDAAMSRFSEWWARAMRGGRAYAQSAWMYRGSPERYRLREVVSILVWGAAIPLVALSLAWSTRGLSFAALGLYPILLARVFVSRVRRGNSGPDAALYAAACVLAKFAQAMGLVGALWERIRARGSGPRVPAAGSERARDKCSSPRRSADWRFGRSRGRSKSELADDVQNRLLPRGGVAWGIDERPLRSPPRCPGREVQ
jgi:GT2 family glycosyltransferase